MPDIDKQREQALADQLRRRNPSAMRECYNLLAGSLTAVCSRYLGNNEDVKDVLQETFIKLFSEAEDFEYQGAGSLKAWATRIAVNESLMFLRHKRPFAIQTDKIEDTEVEDVELEVDELPAAEVQRFIRGLPDGYRVVFCLHVFEDLSHKEIAERLHISPMTSASQYYRAKKILQREITAYRKKGANL